MNHVSTSAWVKIQSCCCCWKWGNIPAAQVPTSVPTEDSFSHRGFIVPTPSPRIRRRVDVEQESSGEERRKTDLETWGSAGLQIPGTLSSAPVSPAFLRVLKLHVLPSHPRHHVRKKRVHLKQSYTLITHVCSLVWNRNRLQLSDSKTSE